MDLVLRNAQLHNGPRVDIAIEDGRIAAVEARFPGIGAAEIDAGASRLPGE